MADLKYEKFDVTQQQNLLDQKLRELESQHFAQRLALITAKSQEEIDGIKAQLVPLEKDIRELRKEEDALKGDSSTS